MIDHKNYFVGKLDFDKRISQVVLCYRLHHSDRDQLFQDQNRYFWSLGESQLLL